MQDVWLICCSNLSLVFLKKNALLLKYIKNNTKIVKYDAN